MELILLKDVEKVGRKGDVVRVRDGFGRNFLIPQSLAMPSTRANKEFVGQMKAKAQVRRAKEKVEAENRAQTLSNLKLKIEAKAGEQEKLFGSVTSKDIKEALGRSGYSFDKKQIHLKEQIKTLGAHSVIVEIYPQVKATISIEVVRKP